jgi:hypothetical protein
VDVKTEGAALAFAFGRLAMTVRSSSSLLVLFAATFCLAQTPAASDHSFTISGTQTWTDTGLDLAAGDVVSLKAETESGSGCDPKGVPASQTGEKLPLASAARGALIAKTTEQASPELVGATGDFRAAQAGRLFLGVNESTPSNCVFAVKATVAQTAASASGQTGMRDKLSSAAQVFMKAQFGEKESKQGESNGVVGGNAAMPGAAGPSTTGGLNLPSVILEADLRKNLDSVPRRVHDAKGNMGDMVNFVIVGSQEKVQAALSGADWHVADLDSKEAGLKAIMNTYQKKDYLEMPMSHLYLWDRMQDFGYEQAQAFSVVATRHHFRIWKAPFTYNNETVWVGAATHDTGFEKDIRTGKLTHKIDPNVDDERENLATGLQKSGKTKSMTYYLPPNPVQDAKNASGGSYHSDGKLLVVFLN